MPLTVYKKVRSPYFFHAMATGRFDEAPSRSWNYIVVLEIPDYARVHWRAVMYGKWFITRAKRVKDPSPGAKCRASTAKVLRIETLEGTALQNEVGISDHDRSFCYVPGETIQPRKPFSNKQSGCCASGIHFFFDRNDAVSYYL